MKSLTLLLLYFFSFFSTPVPEPALNISPTRELYEFYQSFEETALLPDFDLFRLGISGHFHLRDDKKLGCRDIITIIDFRKPSNQKRMWVLDLQERKILFHTLVAHGKNTGELYAKKFSNLPNSNTSSLGFFVTGDTYIGKHGLSLYLDGQEAGFNDKARERAIVLHGADYVSRDFIKKHGRLGRSFGCPSVPMSVHQELINTIAGRTSLFIFYPEQNYISSSKLIRHPNLIANLRQLGPALQPAAQGDTASQPLSN